MESVKKFKLVPCSCCRKEHNNPAGWILLDKETLMPVYHLDLTPGKPEIVELPKPR